MLIGIRKKFIFIANLKTASTSIESVLRHDAEIAILQSPFGKHEPLSVVEARFAWLFQIVNRQDFFVFGVMRDPVDFILSLFNSHHDPKFKESQKLYTGAMDFDQFIDGWAEANPQQLQNQHTRFLSRDGTVGANYIISYANLLQGLQYVASRIDVPGLAGLSSLNVSERRVTRTDLTNRHLNWIASRFQADERFIAEFCDRPLLGVQRVRPSGQVTAPGGQIATLDPRMTSERTPVEVVDLLYKAVLRRAPDDKGREIYLRLLRAGRSSLDLMELLASSSEFNANLLVPAVETQVIPGRSEYDADSDAAIAHYVTDAVRAATEKIRNNDLSDRASFEDAANTSIDLLKRHNQGFAESQSGYLQYHRERFYEIDCVVGNIVRGYSKKIDLLDFGFSVNSFILRRLLSKIVNISAADRPQIRIPDGHFDECFAVDLTDDRLNEVSLGKQFHIIIFSEVIEHLMMHPVKVIRFLLQHLTDDGVIVLTTPNLFSRRKLSDISKRRSPLSPYPETYKHNDAPHFHVREFSMGDLLEMIDQAGGQPSAFFFSSCWDDDLTVRTAPAHELGNLFVVFGAKPSSEAPSLATGAASHGG
jgi:hypothetical protein